MPDAAAETIAIVVLVASLVMAVWRPRGLSEAVVVTPAAALIVAVGIVPARVAGRSLRTIGPTVAFLAAILLLAELCARAGVFDYLGTVAARASHGGPRRLLTIVVTLAAGVTAVLTLDATVILLTPVVLATARKLELSPRPHLYACQRLANSGSLLLPVSNLTNLLAFSATGLSFGRFTALMALPWVVASVAERIGIGAYFRADLEPGPRTASVNDTVGTVDPLSTVGTADIVAAPRYALIVLAATVIGFVITSSAQVAPAWAAAAGCLALLLGQRRHQRLSPPQVIKAANLGFCLFVLALAVVVDAVTRHGLGSVLHHVVPTGSGLLPLLGVATLAAVLANLVNNLPATLALVPVLAGQPAAALAMLIGVNIGPNATYAGSLATLLWRRLLPEDQRPDAGQFHRFALLTVPLILLGATITLWAATRAFGT